MSDPRRWTIYVCPGCGSYASEYDLEPRFGNIVTHERMTEGCAEPAERVEVVPAAREGELEKAEQRGYERACKDIENFDRHVALPEALEAKDRELERLREALREARPYVFNRTQGDDWRAETARSILERVDAALAAPGREDGWHSHQEVDADGRTYTVRDGRKSGGEGDG